MRRELDELPALHAQHAVHAGGKFEIVGRDQRGEAFDADQLHQLLKDDLGGLRVEVAGRFVGEEETRGVGECAADSSALLLAAR